MHTHTATGAHKTEHITVSVQFSKSYLIAKRLLDVLLSIILLIVLSPVLALTVVLLYLSSSGSVFFFQNRLGKNGKLFTIYKFRTMKENPADIINKKVNIRNNGKNGIHNQSVTLAFVNGNNDPRVTALGRILRRTSIDELPQLVNVIKGDMSLVGPRPLVPSMMRDYKDFNRARTLMKPGITGLFQLRDRESKNYVEAMIKHDIEYLDNCSLLLDLKILIMTIPAVTRGHGVF